MSLSSIRLPSLNEVRAERKRRQLQDSFLHWLCDASPKMCWDWPHIQYVCTALRALRTGPKKKLMVFLPPRHGKSELVTVRFSTWFLEYNPEQRIIIGAYNQMLANKFSRKVRRLAEERFTISNERSAVEDWETLQGGGLRAVGVGAGITGQGGNCFVAGTMVLTNIGNIPIEKLTLNPLSCKIASINKQGEVTYEALQAVAKRKGLGIYRVTTTDGRVVEATGDHRFFTGRGWVRASKLTPGDNVLFSMYEEVYDASVCDEQMGKERTQGQLLFKKMFLSASCDKESSKVQNLWQSDGKKNKKVLPRMQATEEGTHSSLSKERANMSRMQYAFSSAATQAGASEVLHLLLREYRTLSAYVRQGKSKIQERSDSTKRTAPFCALLSADEIEYQGKRQESMCDMSCDYQVTCASHRQLANEQYCIKFNNPLRFTSQKNSCTHRLWQGCDTVRLVERICETADVYDIQVDKNHNFFANGILVHNCIIIDDPVKNREEAQSLAYREKVWDWYTDDLYTRLEPGALMVLIMTRWHEDDLAGRILASDDAGSWAVVNLPALAEPGDALGRQEGEALCPERYDRDALLKIKSVMKDSFDALYQQRPSAMEGEIFKREWWQWYNSSAPPHFHGVVQSWDTAFKTKESNDYSVCTTWGVTATGLYLVHRWKGRVEYPELLRTVDALATQWLPFNLLIEDKASGQSLIQDLQRKTRWAVTPVQVDKDKGMRAALATPLIQAGRVFLPEGADWVQDYVDNMATFPNAAHDDDVDSTTQALNYLSGSFGATGAIDMGPERATANQSW